MEVRQFNVTVTFTPKTLAAVPALRDWRVAIPATINPLIFAGVQRGDTLLLQGIPSEQPMVVIGRMWEVMGDETTLTLLLEVFAD